jgi:hypothetical protein
MNLTKRELIEMIKIFGARKVLSMYANRKINISASQRDELIDIKNEKKEIKYNKIVKVEAEKCTK